MLDPDNSPCPSSPSSNKTSCAVFCATEAEEIFKIELDDFEPCSPNKVPQKLAQLKEALKGFLDTKFSEEEMVSLPALTFALQAQHACCHELLAIENRKQAGPEETT